MTERAAAYCTFNDAICDAIGGKHSDVLLEVASMIEEEDEPLRSRLLAKLEDGDADEVIVDAIAHALKLWASEVALQPEQAKPELVVDNGTVR